MRLPGLHRHASNLPMIRPAVAADVAGIVKAFLESAEHHASLDPARYSLPPVETISPRYGERPQDHPDDSNTITLVADLNGEIAGFIDARIERSPDPMHREMLYCYMADIAVSHPYRNQGVGAQLLLAAEDWGRTHGAAFASLEYHVANIRAGSLYERLGYSMAAITSIKRLDGKVSVEQKR